MTDPTARLRVAHVICTDAFAGAERYVTTLSRALDALGCEVVVVGGSSQRMPAELAGASVHWQSGASVASAAAALARAGRFDIVHAHMTAAELAAGLAHPRTRGPIVCTRHFAQRRGSSAPARIVGRALDRLISRQIAISDFVAHEIDGPSVVIAPGVPTVTRPEPANREPIVLLAQRLESEKRTDVALRVWAAAGLQTRGWRLQIAGDGAQRTTLTNLAQTLGITQSVDFLGARTDIAELFDQASIFLATRADEPFGLSVVEAMAAGLPVVAARGGGHDETVGRCPEAVLFPADDPAKAGALLAELAGDETRRISYGRALRDLQRAQFTIDRQAQMTMDLYRSLLGSAS